MRRSCKNTETEGKGPVTMEVGIGVMLSTSQGAPGTASHHQKLGEGHETAPLSGPSKRTNVGDTLISDVQPPDCERINAYCFKLPSLWPQDMIQASSPLSLSSPRSPPHLPPQGPSHRQHGWADRFLSLRFMDEETENRNYHLHLLHTYFFVSYHPSTWMVFLLQEPCELRTQYPHFTDEEPEA